MSLVPSRRFYALVLVLLALPSSCLAVEGTLWGGVFGPGSYMPAQPQPARVMTEAVGDVGVRIASDPYFGFRFQGMIETILEPPDIGRFSLNAASVRYEFGFRRPMGDHVTVTFQHGSWHQLDTVGLIPKYNRAGIELKFGTSK